MLRICLSILTTGTINVKHSLEFSLNPCLGNNVISILSVSLSYSIILVIYSFIVPIGCSILISKPFCNYFSIFQTCYVIFVICILVHHVLLLCFRHQIKSYRFTERRHRPVILPIIILSGFEIAYNELLGNIHSDKFCDKY